MRFAQTIGSFFVPIHREGWPFIAAVAVATIILGLFSTTLFWLGTALTLWCAYFFRDPERVTPTDDDLVISPADGIVSFIGPVVPPRELELDAPEMTRISIYMNAFSVHVNRAPVRGTVRQVAYRPGRFLNAGLDKASSDNERNGVVIESPRGQLAVVQIAGLVARRIVCWAEVGSPISVGERFGLIRFGSRLDVYLPAGATPRVAVGQIAIAGETIIAEFGGVPIPLVRIS